MKPFKSELHEEIWLSHQLSFEYHHLHSKYRGHPYFIQPITLDLFQTFLGLTFYYYLLLPSFPPPTRLHRHIIPMYPSIPDIFQKEISPFKTCPSYYWFSFNAHPVDQN